ncbi:lysozyme inhibitor LprI family protein [Desulfocurvus sp. DL9XJH121]
MYAPFVPIRTALAALACVLVLCPAALAGNQAHGPADCGGDMSPADRMLCENVQLDAADKAMARLYTELMGSLDKDAGAMLRAAQEAWMAYRDANFGIFSSAASARGQEGLVQQVHAMRLATEARVRELRELAGLLDEGGMLAGGPQAPPAPLEAEASPAPGPEKPASPAPEIPEPDTADLPKTRIKSDEGLADLLGEHGLRLQWLAGAASGRAVVRDRDGVLLLSGSQRKGDDELLVQGHIQSVGRDSFVLNGSLTTRIGFLNDGEPCVRKGVMRFARKGGRPFWRMQGIVNPCCGVSDYVDLYVPPPVPGD